LSLLLRRRVGPALAHAFFRPAAKRDVVVDVGETGGELGFAEIGKGRTHPVERESGALFGDADGFAQALFASLPSLGHLLRREETPFAVRVQQSGGGRLGDRQVVSQGSEHVVYETTRLVHVARILRREPGKLRPLGELDELSRERRFVAAGVVELDFYRKAFVEQVSPATERAFGGVRLSRANERRDLAGRGTGERVQALRMVGELLPGDLGAAAAFRLHRFVPRRPLTDARERDESGKVAVAGLVAGEKCRGVAVDVQFCADERTNRILTDR